jgi:hypothetical protein
MIFLFLFTVTTNAQASRQTGPCLRFLFKLAFSAVGAISVHAQFSCPVEASYCWWLRFLFPASVGQFFHFSQFPEDAALSRLYANLSK